MVTQRELSNRIAKKIHEAKMKENKTCEYCGVHSTDNSHGSNCRLRKKFNLSDTFDKSQIINEADLQSGAIEFSYTGELIPVEKVMADIKEFIQRLLTPNNISKGFVEVSTIKYYAGDKFK